MPPVAKLLLVILSAVLELSMELVLSLVLLVVAPLLEALLPGTESLIAPLSVAEPLATLL